MKYKYRKNLTQKELKKTEIEKLTQLLLASKSIVLFFGAAVPHLELEALRAKLSPVGAHLRFLKNTLFKVAAKAAKLPDALIADSVLKEATAAMFINGDDFIAPIKVLKEVLGKNETVKMKIGFLDSDVYEGAKVYSFANIPSKEELIGKLVGSLKAPQYRLHNALSYNIRALAMGLSERAKKVSS